MAPESGALPDARARSGLRQTPVRDATALRLDVLGNGRLRASAPSDASAAGSLMAAALQDRADLVRTSVDP
jgi:hypothetical protein